MKPFRIRKDAKTWFKELRPKVFKIDFDIYYFCFIAGIATKRKQQCNIDETAELVVYFPDRYKHRGKLLVALFLTRELDQLGITLDEKRIVHLSIAKLVDHGSKSFLSDEGVDQFNKYANAGYEVLLDWFDDKPRTLETFLRTFNQKVKIAVEKS